MAMDAPRTFNRLLLRVMDGGEMVVALAPHTPLIAAIDGYNPLVLSAHFNLFKKMKKSGS